MFVSTRLLKVTNDIKIYYLLFVIFFIFDILRRTATFSKRRLVFFVVFFCGGNIACELSQPMGKTEFSSTAKNGTNSVS